MRHKGSIQATLQERPEVLDTVCVRSMIAESSIFLPRQEQEQWQKQMLGFFAALRMTVVKL
jgi:hypothetical protein